MAGGPRGHGAADLPASDSGRGIPAVPADPAVPTGGAGVRRL